MKSGQEKSVRDRLKWLNAAIVIGSFGFFIENSTVNSNDLTYFFIIGLCFFTISMVVSAYLLILDELSFHNEYVDDSISEDIDKKMNIFYFEVTKSLEPLSKLSGILFVLGLFFSLLNINVIFGMLFVVVIFLLVCFVRRKIKKFLTNQ